MERDLEGGPPGSAHGAAECGVLFVVGSRRTLADDWFLAVMVVFANATGFAVAARYGVRLVGVAVAGVAGMTAGGWVGVHTVGSYEYTVPTPPEGRELRMVVPLKGVPDETVRRVPVGSGLGVLVGFAAGAVLYARLARADDPPPDDDPDAGS